LLLLRIDAKPANTKDSFPLDPQKPQGHFNNVMENYFNNVMADTRTCCYRSSLIDQTNNDAWFLGTDGGGIWTSTNAVVGWVRVDDLNAINKRCCQPVGAPGSQHFICQLTFMVS